jgi:hypothetical protein
VSGGGAKGHTQADGRSRGRSKAKSAQADIKCRKDKYRDYYIEPDGCRYSTTVYTVILPKLKLKFM